MRVRNTFVFCFIVALVTTAIAACGSSASSYPQKPISIFVGYAPGGMLDLSARALAEAAKPFLPQPLTIVNKPGANGSVAAAEVVTGKADGYTLFHTASGTMLLQPLLVELPYKSPDDYRPIINLVKSNPVLIVRNDAQWKTGKEIMDFAKANPGKLKMGHSGIGGMNHLNIEVLKRKSGADITSVPFEGDNPTVTQLLGGHVDAIFVGPAPIAAHVKAGTLRILAVADVNRNPRFPDAPTLKELGYDVSVGSLYFPIAPKGTPDAVIQTLHDAFKKGLETESFKKFGQDNFVDIDYIGSSDLKTRLVSDTKLYAELAATFK